MTSYLPTGSLSTQGARLRAALLLRQNRLPIYINPAYVVTLRPDPTNPDEVSIITVRDGETLPRKAARVHNSGNVK